MPDYDVEQFDAPAPMATAVLRTQARSLSHVAMLIDSGSDVTLLPASSISQLGLQADPHRSYELVAFDGTKSVSKSVQCDLVFLGRIFRGVYLIVEATYGILGRDVLNWVSLVLDGPRLKWREENALE
jgi:hypothetical protein